MYVNSEDLLEASSLPLKDFKPEKSGLCIHFELIVEVYVLV